MKRSDDGHARRPRPFPVTPAFICLCLALAQPAVSQSGPLEDARAVQEKFDRFQKHMGAKGAGQSPEAGLPAKAGGAGPEEESALGISLQILFGLVFVLVLAVISLRLLKRLQRGAAFKPGGQESDFFQVLETCYLDSQHKVVAMRVGSRACVVGISPQSVSLLLQMDGSPEELGFGNPREGGNSAAFSESLSKVLDRFKKPKRVSDILGEK